MMLRYRTRLSGRLRLRPAMWGRVVLQEEVLTESSARWVPPCPPPPGYKDPEKWNAEEAERIERTWTVTGSHWRDAKAGELMGMRPIVKFP